MTNAMLACCSEWGGHVTTEELINRSALLLSHQPVILSGVPKRLPLVPSSDTRRPLCRVHA